MMVLRVVGAKDRGGSSKTTRDEDKRREQGGSLYLSFL